MESLIKRAKDFIGMGDDGGEEKEYGQQLDMSAILKGKKEHRGEAGGLEILVCEPKVYEDSLNIATHLRSGAPVVINLKHLDPTEGTRLIDFVCGTAYAIEGHMMKIGDSIFLFSPKSININSAEERTSLGDELAFESNKREGFFSR